MIESAMDGRLIEHGRWMVTTFDREPLVLLKPLPSNFLPVFARLTELRLPRAIFESDEEARAAFKLLAKHSENPYLFRNATLWNMDTNQWSTALRSDVSWA